MKLSPRSCLGFLAALTALATLSCAGPQAAPVAPPPAVSATDPATAAAARKAVEEQDLLLRLQETLAQPKEDPVELMNSLERLLPAWESEQRRGREKPLENIITLKVVANVDAVIDAFRNGSRDRQLVAAWALGFARVPDNDLGLDSPHEKALAALAGTLQSRDDALLRNELLALWKLGDPDTPLRPLLDLMVQHHEPEVRSNAALALCAVLTERTLPVAQDSVLVALSDPEAKVRLHAAAIARRFPGPATTTRLLAVLPVEEKPLVRASMAAALGAARSREAASLLLTMLGSNFEIEATTSHAALVLIYGEDRGTNPAAWSDLVR